MKKKIAILGSTGSIGTQTLKVIDEFPEKFKIEILSGHKNQEQLLLQVNKYQPRFVVSTDNECFKILKNEFKDKLNTKVLLGIEGIITALKETELDIVIGAISGAAGIRPIIEALSLGIDVALANKETIVAAGKLVEKVKDKSGAKILPVDSEHSAIWQCLEQDSKTVSKLILTASGGPFRKLTKNQLEKVTPEEALKHPNWSMGKKITVDSATLMNKGLEVIEAHHLFNVNYEEIDVVIHPQSIVHSMVEYGDGSVLAHLGLPDMKIPIQYALTYPERWNNNSQKLDLIKVGNLEFYTPNLELFPSLKLAYEAGKIGYTMPTVLNAANEIAVELFLNGKISFTQIPVLIEKTLEDHQPLKEYDLEELLQVDEWARQKSRQYKL